MSNTIIPVVVTEFSPSYYTLNPYMLKNKNAEEGSPASMN